MSWSIENWDWLQLEGDSSDTDGSLTYPQTRRSSLVVLIESDSDSAPGIHKLCNTTELLNEGEV